MKRIVSLFLLLCGCQAPFYEGGEELGADDFLIESYALKEAPLAASSPARVTITGGVKQGGVLVMPGATLPLKEALLMAGGITYVGDRDRIVVRRREETGPKVFILSWEHLERLPDESFLLKSGDEIYVAPKTFFKLKRDSQ